MSTAIRWYFGDKFSHTYFKAQLPNLIGPSILQATGAGIGICSNENFIKHNEVVREFDIEISPELFYEIYNEFHARAGTKYGYIQNIGILITRELLRIGVKLNVNPFQDGMVCSEYLAYCLEEIYPEDWNSSTQDFNLTTPKDVYTYLINRENGNGNTTKA
jgi:hypothetical protein